MANAGEDNTRKKEREPITYLCSIILLVACIAVIGTFVYDHYIADDKETIDTGDTVELNYTGAYYNFYDEGGAIFQTTVSSIDDNSKYLYSPGYSFASGTISMTVGSGKYLAGFEDAVRGHKVGDTVKVHLTAEEGYWLGGYWSNLYSAKTLADTSTLSVSYTVAEFGKIYDKQAYGEKFDSKLGIPAIAILDSQAGNVIVTFYPEAGKSYTSGDVVYKVNTVTETEFTYEVQYDFVKTGKTIEPVDGEKFNEVRMVEINGDLICGLSLDGKSMIVKNSAERNNIDLYFTIEIVN
ncbi:MAG: FKBP-type peptidyl-prolyl cis-trans isomerase [archaeon]|nr:FKBP-type peptidyl-prolyl cis-trans isomerase [archaeon]